MAASPDPVSPLSKKILGLVSRVKELGLGFRVWLFAFPVTVLKWRGQATIIPPLTMCGNYYYVGRGHKR